MRGRDSSSWLFERQVLFLAFFVVGLFGALTSAQQAQQLRLYNVTNAACPPNSGLVPYNLTIDFWPSNTPAESLVVFFRNGGQVMQWMAYASLTPNPSKQNCTWNVSPDTTQATSLGGELWIPQQPIGTVIYINFDCSTSGSYKFTIEPVIPTYVFQNKAQNYYSASIQDAGIHANWFAFNVSTFTNDLSSAFVLRTELCTPPSPLYHANTRIVFPGVTQTSSCDPPANGFIDSIYNWNVQWYVGTNLQTNSYHGVIYVYVAFQAYTNYQFSYTPSLYSIIITGYMDNWSGSGPNPFATLSSPNDWYPLQLNKDLYLIPSFGVFPYNIGEFTVYYTTNLTGLNSGWLGSLCYLQTQGPPSYNGTWLNSASTSLLGSNFFGIMAPDFFDSVSYSPSNPQTIAIAITDGGLAALTPFYGSVTSFQRSSLGTAPAIAIAVMASAIAVLLSIILVFWYKYNKERKQYMAV